MISQLKGFSNEIIGIRDNYGGKRAEETYNKDFDVIYCRTK